MMTEQHMSMMELLMSLYRKQGDTQRQIDGLEGMLRGQGFEPARQMAAQMIDRPKIGRPPGVKNRIAPNVEAREEEQVEERVQEKPKLEKPKSGRPNVQLAALQVALNKALTKAKSEGVPLLRAVRSGSAVAKAIRDGRIKNGKIVAGEEPVSVSKVKPAPTEALTRARIQNAAKMRQAMAAKRAQQKQNVKQAINGADIQGSQQESQQ